MKKFLTMLVAMLAMVSLGGATCGFWPWPACPVDPGVPVVPDCPTGVCDTNYITQTNVADAISGQAYADVGFWSQYGDGSLDVKQEQKNCAAVLGEGNIVTQNNKADARGTEITQIQDNIAMVVGSSNTVVQANDALATGVAADGAYGIYETQNQKNLMLVIGANNYASQSNVAKAYSDSAIWPAYPIEQTQKNVGLLLGKKNNLVQSNDAEATMLKCIEVDPKIAQIQKNIAFAVNNCDDCKVDTTYGGVTSFTWPTVSAPAPVIPAIVCPTGVDC
jgi:hypothetical protein